MSKDKSPKKPKKPSYWDDRTKALMQLAKGRGLNPHLRVVLAYLISCDNEEHKMVWPSQDKIAQDTGLGSRTVRRVLAVAEAVEAIGTVYRTRKVAIEAGIPVPTHKKNGQKCNPNLDTIKIHYDWDGYHGKLKQEMVSAINRVIADKSNPAVLREARPRSPAPKPGPEARPPGPTNAPPSEEARKTLAAPGKVNPSGTKVPPGITTGCRLAAPPVSEPDLDPETKAQIQAILDSLNICDGD